MTVANDMAAIASAMASPARIKILETLATGTARSATDLAVIAAVQANTATTHLKILCEANLIKVVKQGRYRYFKIKDASVGDLIEILGERADVTARNANIPLSEMAFSRTCYDHLAGWMGVQLTQSLLHNQHIIINDKSFDLTDSGKAFLLDLGVSIDKPKNTRRIFARTCQDWTEGEMHIGGILGAQLFSFFVTEKWVTKNDDYREVTVLAKGRTNFKHYFGIVFS